MVRAEHSHYFKKNKFKSIWINDTLNDRVFTIALPYNNDILSYNNDILPYNNVILPFTWNKSIHYQCVNRIILH